MQKIQLSGNHKNKFVLVDDEDFEKFNKIKWYLNPDDYAYTSRAGKKMHREILPAPAGMDIDHINRNRLDNRKINLRIVTHLINLTNREFKIENTSRKKYKTNTSGFKGVNLQKYGKYEYWRAYLYFKGKIINIGKFKSAEEAAKAYDKKAFELFGNNAKLNFKLSTP